MHRSRFIRAVMIVMAGLFCAPAHSVTAALPEILVLSNRADLISDGDALVEVKWPAGTNLSQVRVVLNGALVTSSFALRPNGRYMGLVTGLKNGDNVLYARYAGGASQIKITNYPRGGPIFSGKQLEPWVCARQTATSVVVTVPGTSLSANVTTRVSGLASNPVDDDCNATTLYSYYYQPKALEGSACLYAITGGTACFVPFSSVNDPSTRPADSAIADFTNDRGDTVKSIIRVERGAMNRGIYQLVAFYDPAKPQAPWDPQKGWNGKLLWKMGASASVSRFQTPPNTGIFDDKALRRGFIVASSSLTDHGTNSNNVLGAETIMMVKERIREVHGPIRYTIGDGCSGGSIKQHDIASSYPGLLDAIQPNCSYADSTTVFIEIFDCGELQANYYTTPNGSTLTGAQRVAINGHIASTGASVTGFCQVWINQFLPAQNPSLQGNCGTGWPAALTYSKTSTPQRLDGIRCDAPDHDVAMTGSFVDTDGATKANRYNDNEGLQYGLKALRDGVISAEQFVQLNEGVGGYDNDLVWSPAGRAKANPAALNTFYSAGLVSDGRQLAKVPIIDLRGNQNAAGCIHMNWRPWGMRDRLDRDAGGHGNQVIWGYSGNGGAGAPGAAITLRAFLTMDTWLSKIEADPSALPLEQKVLNNKPTEITGLVPSRPVADFCVNSPTATGSTDAQLTAAVNFGDPACPIAFQSSPRQVAGGPAAENIFKCQLKPIDFGDPDYGATLFSPDQQARLMTVFSTGVCDWSKPGVSQVPVNTWTTFAAGPGGVQLPPPPASFPYP